MKCLRCGYDHLNRIKGLSLELNGVEQQSGVSVSGIHCGNCGLLTLEMEPAAAPGEVTEPISEPKPTSKSSRTN
jgi:hypothetical protein